MRSGLPGATVKGRDAAFRARRRVLASPWHGRRTRQPASSRDAGGWIQPFGAHGGTRARGEADGSGSRVRSTRPSHASIGPPELSGAILRPRMSGEARTCRKTCGPPLKRAAGSMSGAATSVGARSPGPRPTALPCWPSDYGALPLAPPNLRDPRCSPGPVYADDVLRVRGTKLDHNAIIGTASTSARLPGPRSVQTRGSVGRCARTMGHRSRAAPTARPEQAVGTSHEGRSELQALGRLYFGGPRGARPRDREHAPAVAKASRSGQNAPLSVWGTLT